MWEASKIIQGCEKAMAFLKGLILRIESLSKPRNISLGNTFESLSWRTCDRELRIIKTIFPVSSEWPHTPSVTCVRELLR